MGALKTEMVAWGPLVGRMSKWGMFVQPRAASDFEVSRLKAERGGVTPPGSRKSGFPDAWLQATVAAAQKMIEETPGLRRLRAAEMAISDVYKKHEYSAPRNADLYPERIIAGALKNADEQEEPRNREMRIMIAPTRGAGGVWSPDELIGRLKRPMHRIAKLYSLMNGQAPTRDLTADEPDAWSITADLTQDMVVALLRLGRAVTESEAKAICRNVAFDKINEPNIVEHNPDNGAYYNLNRGHEREMQAQRAGFGEERLLSIGFTSPAKQPLYEGDPHEWDLEDQAHDRHAPHFLSPDNVEFIAGLDTKDRQICEHVLNRINDRPKRPESFASKIASAAKKFAMQKSDVKLAIERICIKWEDLK